MASDIFDEYAKLAIEKGIIKVAKDTAESKELKKYKNDSYPRAGSDTIDIIEKKYNTKPDKPKSQQYEKNIMEIAHPNKVILNPAYDKINALIENNIERQKIMINITQKPVNGHLTQHKYAEAALAKSLIAVANDLDNKNIELLRKLADECIEDLHKKADIMDELGDWFKNRGHDVTDVGTGSIGGAAIGAVLGGIIGAFGGPAAAAGGAWTGARVGTLVGGLISYIWATAPQAKNVVINAQIAKTRLADLRKDNQNSIFLSSLDNALTNVIATSTAYVGVVDQIHSQTNSADVKKKAEDITTKYQQQLTELDGLIDVFESDVAKGQYTHSAGEILDKVEAPWLAMVGDPVKKAAGALRVLKEVNEEALQGISTVRQEVNNVSNAAHIMTPAGPSAPVETSATNLKPGTPEWFESIKERMRTLQTK